VAGVGDVGVPLETGGGRSDPAQDAQAAQRAKTTHAVRMGASYIPSGATVRCAPDCAGPREVMKSSRCAQGCQETYQYRQVHGLDCARLNFLEGQASRTSGTVG